MVSKKHAKELLKESGQWVLIHSIDGTRGYFKKPNIKPESLAVFQAQVDSYARKLALASNIVAQDGAESHELRGGTFGQRFRTGREEEMILPEDVICAAEALESGDISIDPDMKIILPGPCTVCDSIFDHVLDSAGPGLIFLCPSCKHVVYSSSSQIKVGDPEPKPVAELI